MVKSMNFESILTRHELQLYVNISCITLSKFINLSVFQFLYLQNEANNSTCLIVLIKCVGGCGCGCVMPGK